MEPVANPGRLGDEILAGLDEEAELAARVRQPDRWQVRFPEGYPGDGEGVTRIALAGPPGPEPLAVAELRPHLDGREAGGKESPGRRRAIARRALQADSIDPELGQPRAERLDPGRVVRNGPLGHDAAELVEGARRERRLVGVDTNHAHRNRLLPGRTMGAGQARQMCVEVKVHALMKPGPARSSARTEALVTVANGQPAAHSQGAIRPRRRDLRSPAKAVSHPTHIRAR